MTEDQFTELVNLYLDKEISAEDLKLLKEELATNSDRERAFSERCRLHQAMRLALNPEGARAPARSISSDAAANNCSSVQRKNANVYGASVTRFPRWLLGSGVAASLLIGLILLPPIFRDTTGISSLPELAGLAEGESSAVDPLDAIGRDELRRFANLREQRQAQRHASLVSQMRLLGLRPELTPEEKELQEVSMAAAQRPERGISQAELFQRIQQLRVIPDPDVLQIDEMPAVSTRWPSGLGASLVSFEN